MSRKYRRDKIRGPIIGNQRLEKIGKVFSLSVVTIGVSLLLLSSFGFHIGHISYWFVLTSTMGCSLIKSLFKKRR